MVKWRKTMLVLAVAAGLVSTTTAAAGAPSAISPAPNMRIYIDGALQEQVLLYQSRTYVPLIAYKDPAYISYAYEASSHSTVIRIPSTNTVIRLKPGSSAATVNGTSVTLNQPVLSAKGRTYVSLQFLTDYLSAVMKPGEKPKEVVVRTKSGQYDYDLLRTGYLGNARSAAIRMPLSYAGSQLAPRAEGTLVTYSFPEGEAHRYVLDYRGIQQYVVVGKDGIARVEWQKDAFSANEIGKAPADFGAIYYYSYNTTSPDRLTYGQATTLGGQHNELGSYLVSERDYEQYNVFPLNATEMRTDGFAEP